MVVQPVVVVQNDAFNRSQISTVICVAVTTNMRVAEAPGNVLLPLSTSGLDRESVVNVSQILTLDKGDLIKRIGKLPKSMLQAVFYGIDVVLGR